MKKKLPNLIPLSKSGIKKLLLPMKLTLIIIFLSVLQVSATVYSQITVNLDVQDKSIREVLKTIEQQSHIRFFYSDDLLVMNERIDIKADNKNIISVLDDIFSKSLLTYKAYDNNLIVIVPRELLQQQKITGTVTDENGNPMPGVNIQVEGTTFGVISDLNGEYQINLPNENVILIFSFVGYNTEKISATGKTIINIKLISTTSALDEVIVIGYGTQSKRVVTGSIASIDMSTQSTLPVTNISQAVRGRVAGVQFTDNARPGQGGTILIRGERSISASNAPLIILDGVPFDGSLADINSNDVESMDILKDASAAAIYGSKAANGVVLITSRMGKTEKPVIRFNTFYAINSPMKWLKILSPERYIQKTLDYRSENGMSADPALINTYLQTSEAENYAAGKTVNPWDVVSQKSRTSSYDLSVSAKSKNTAYFVSGAIVNEKGLIYNDNSKRISFRTNVETKVADWLSFGIASQYSNRDLSGLEASLSSAYATSPFSTLWDPDGTPTKYTVVEDQLTSNPLYESWLTKNEEIYNNLFANLYTLVDIPFIKGLKFRLNYSPNLRWSHEYNFMKQDPRLTNNITKASKFNQENFDWTLENILSYSRDINENNNIDITLLYGRNHASLGTTTATGTTFPIDLVTWNNLGQAATQTVASNAAVQEGVSSMARINYRFKNRYLLTLTGRRDGASVFAKNNKYTFFPSAAVSWIISEESFMKNISNLDLLKFRFSYGAVGNQAITPYQSLSLTARTMYVFGDGGPSSTGIYDSNMGNSDLKWETTYTTNIAADFQAFKGRIGGTLEYYNLNTKDLILSRSLPVMTGYSDVLVNLGQTNNKGVELTLRTINIHTGDFEWRSDIAFSMNKNKIVHIYNSDINGDGIEDDDLGNYWFIGQPIKVAYDYAFDGIFQNGDVDLPPGYKAGWVRLKDLNGDGLYTAAYDRKVIGDLEPKYRWSFNNDFIYKNFTLSVFFNALQGWIGYFNKVNVGDTNPFPDGGNGNKVERASNMMDFDWWTTTNPSNTHPSFNYQNPVDHAYYENRSFVRLQDVSLSYDFPKTTLQKVKIEGLRAYISGRNLYTWTKWEGPDPESDQIYYPTSRTISFGLSLIF